MLRCLATAAMTLTIIFIISRLEHTELLLS
jgi:hypothetical protein